MDCSCDPSWGKLSASSTALPPVRASPKICSAHVKSALLPYSMYNRIMDSLALKCSLACP